MDNEEIIIDPYTQKILIELRSRRRGKTNQGGADNQPPPAQSAPLPGYQPQPIRHKRELKQPGVIVFYDWALYKPQADSPDFIDRDYTILVSLDEASNQTDAVLTMVRDAARPLLNAPIGISTRDWTKRFKRISYDEGSKYQFSVATDSDAIENEWIDKSNPHWTEKGLKYEKFNIIATAFPPKDTFVYYQFGGAFSALFHSGGCKITKEARYEAQEVALQVDKSKGDVSVFLNPCFFYNAVIKFESSTDVETSGFSSSGAYFVYEFSDCSSPTRFPAITQTTTITSENNEKTLNYFFSTWQRKQILATTAPELPPTGEVIIAFVNELKKHPRARAIDRQTRALGTSIRAFPTFPDGGIPIYANRLCNWGYGSNPHSFPGSISVNDIPENPLDFPVDDTPSVNEWEIIVDKALAAAVMQGDNIFYIWRKPNQ